MNAQQYREHLFQKMISAHREIGRIKKVLSQKKFSREFKDQSCKTAIKLHKTRIILNGEAESARAEMIDAWMRLPENRSSGTVNLSEMLDFLKSLTKRPRKKKFMKNQRVLQLE